jgi:hypothetical protein
MFRLISFDIDREDFNIGGSYELPEVLPVPFLASRIEVGAEIETSRFAAPDGVGYETSIEGVEVEEVWAVGHAFRERINVPRKAEAILDKMVEEVVRDA